MTLPVEIYNKQCIKTEWHVAVPGVNQSVERSSLSLGTNKWVFEFKTCFSVEELFKISFVKRGKKTMSDRLLVTLYLRTKDGRYVFISSKEIDCAVGEILNIPSILLVKKHPQVFFPQKTLKFIFTFDFGIWSFQDYKRADRQCLENLSLDYRKLMEDGSDSDVSLKCGDRTIPAHRLILGARSEVFRTMLQSDMLEGREGSVEIVDMEPEILQIFIRYLYTGSLPELNKDTALALYEAGDKYHVNALKARCSDFLAKNLTREKACEVLVTADAHSDDDLKERVISYILKEKIPSDKDMWPKFWDSHLKLAFEILNRAYEQSACSQ